MQNLNDEYKNIIQSRFDENLASGNEMWSLMTTSTAIYDGRTVECLYMPKLFSERAFDHLKNQAKTIYDILTKVTQQYLDNPNYRKHFSFSPELENLILSEVGYPCLLPIMRADIFFNEEDFSFKFCEFNTDGTSGMNEVREIENAVKKTDAYLQMQKKYKLENFELMKSWIREFMDIYRTYDKNVETPHIAIADFTEFGFSSEFVEFEKLFKSAGHNISICEIRDLSYDGQSLKTPKGEKIDVIYRRAVTGDIMTHINDVKPFIQAVKDNNVCLIGHFRTQIAHNKIIFEILNKPETLSFLTESEQDFIKNHIPKTFILSKGNFDLDEILNNKDKWVIKPSDLYASKGVFVGLDLTREEWEKAVTDNLNTEYILQEYCVPYRSNNLDFTATVNPEFKMYNNTTGLFIYNGKLQGLYSRAGLKGDVSTRGGGFSMASVLVRG